MRCDSDESKPPDIGICPTALPAPILRLIPASHPKPPALVHPPSQAGLLPPILLCFPHSFQDLCPQHPTGLLLQVTWDFSFLRFPPLCLCCSPHWWPLLLPEMFLSLPEPHPWDLFGSPDHILSLGLLRRRPSLSYKCPLGFSSFLNFPHNLIHSKSSQFHT